MCPARSAFAPGKDFSCKDRDFNTVGSIFAQEAGHSITQALQDRIAVPAGYHATQAAHLTFEATLVTAFPIWRIYLSNRNPVRLGQVLLAGSVWGRAQIVPPDWIAQMFTPVPNEGPDSDYGLLWSITRDSGLVVATGARGQILILGHAAGFAPEDKNNPGI